MHDLGEGHFYACIVCSRPTDFDARDTVKAQRVIYTVATSGEHKKLLGRGLAFYPESFTEDCRPWVEVV